ncbi:glyoxylase-like metal-dependent hydrolase (beta-lactamase superfamily II) [Ensifer adhaerens]|uniref:Glyoxylase-like metal-dependent hydrolase (Beta-lactamase superfamily II) n=1 Tax=Ensifer adhaerens TaxID=106592 RepID=A0ACC5SQV4_ENSAD|nr:MBL fold metallo-hydrolase [Ensifer adhaerens]MBP1871203.1 glyoxylase-like metal-dependent hydrolase (beta-lactamase superfamily II) [Ensifer adhaerens]
MPDMTSTLTILQPYPGIFAYYDGRIAGTRLHSEGPNWLDDGAYALGVASYAIVDGGEALVYDTHISLPHAEAIRTHLESLGVTSIRVVLSHWHKDHVAGNAVFVDCEIIALALTAERLAENREKIETATPPIHPLVMPTRLFEGRLDLKVGQRMVELHHFAIHSADGNVLWLPEEKLLLAGDTVEDCATFIAEAEHVATHIAELKRLRRLPIAHILPSHGDRDRISAGGYDGTLIDANRSYLERLEKAAAEGAQIGSLKDFVADEIAAGSILYFAPYEDVHDSNVARMRAAAEAN